MPVSPAPSATSQPVSGSSDVTGGGASALPRLPLSPLCLGVLATCALASAAAHAQTTTPTLQAVDVVDAAAYPNGKLSLDTPVDTGSRLGLTVRHEPIPRARLLAGEWFDAILCDLSMPHLRGDELFEELRPARPALADRFVFLTGGATEPGAEELLATIPNEQLDKPLDLRALRAIVHR